MKLELVMLCCLFALIDSFRWSNYHLKSNLWQRDSSLFMNKLSPEAWDLVLSSPCKINLFLRILGRRPTGYHDLASLFQAITLADQMGFSLLPDGSVEDVLVCSDSSLAIDKSNLVIKALDLMRLKTGMNKYFKVYLEKIVPMQAGLGGGSGNAATAMHAFNVLTGYPATIEQLKDWSGDIGSDITFFFSTGTAYCTGRGEIIESLEPLPYSDKTRVHIIKPKQGLSTALVFKTLKLDQCSSVDPKAILAAYVENGAILAAKLGNLVNDLEKPAFDCEPFLATIKSRLLQADSKLAGVMMSGSGTSVYALSEASDTIDEKSLVSATSGNGSEYDGIQRFTSNFINKIEDIYSWY